MGVSLLRAGLSPETLPSPSTTVLLPWLAHTPGWAYAQSPT